METTTTVCVPLPIDQLEELVELLGNLNRSELMYLCERLDVKYSNCLSQGITTLYHKLEAELERQTVSLQAKIILTENEYLRVVRCQENEDFDILCKYIEDVEKRRDYADEIGEILYMLGIPHELIDEIKSNENLDD